MDEHLLQVERSHCVPACVVMVEIWRGQRPADPDQRQRELFETYNIGGLCAVQNFQGVIGGEWRQFDVDDPDVIDVFANTIDRGSWAIVNCLAGEFGHWLRARGFESPHGQLPDGALPYHAVCVTGRTRRHLHVLDPWTLGAHQPLELSFEDLGKIWTGQALFVQRSIRG